MPCSNHLVALTSYFGRLKTVANSIGVAAVDYVKRLEKDVDEKYFPDQIAKPSDAAADASQQLFDDNAKQEEKHKQEAEDSVVQRKCAQSSKLLNSLVNPQGSLKEVRSSWNMTAASQTNRYETIGHYGRTALFRAPLSAVRTHVDRWPLDVRHSQGRGLGWGRRALLTGRSGASRAP